MDFDFDTALASSQGCVKVRLAAFAKIYVCDNVAELE